MRGPFPVVLVVAFLSCGPAVHAQTPPSVTLVAPGNADPTSQRFMKLVSIELTRRGQSLVSESEAAALLGRPLAAAIADCSGDDLCFIALGQVVRASHVLVGKATISTKDVTKYDCVFSIVESRSGKTRGSMVVAVQATDPGLVIAANTVAETLAPRPRIAAVVTPTPVVPLPTPVAIATPTPAPTATGPLVAIGTAEPTPTPGTTGMDTVPMPPKVRRPRPPLSKDPAFWSIAGAGLLVLGVGAFFGASSLQQDEPEKKGTSTVQVRF